MEIRGKTALVLGGTRGIGRATVLALARAGARLIIPWYDWPEDVQSLGDALSGMGADHLLHHADLRDPEHINLLARIARDRWETIEILINTIERGGMPVVHGAYTPEQWDIEIDTTLTAKWRVVNKMLPLMKVAPEGVVVTLSSIAGLVGRCGPAGLIFNDGYAAANAGIGSFTRTWARLGAPSVRVVELMLGFIETRHAVGTRGWGLLSEDQRQAIRSHTLVGRTGTVDEVVRTIFFLIQDATFMTGATLCLDGGYLLGGEDIPPLPGSAGDLDIKLPPEGEGPRPQASSSSTQSGIRRNT